jgi:flagellar biosynthesis/type III secretory pathway protein FliH
MYEFKLKLPNKIKRAEIIPSESFNTEKLIPFSEFSDSELNTVFDSYRDEEKPEPFDLAELLSVIPKTHRTIFYEERAAPIQSKPVQISLDKLNKNLVPVSEVQVEIQHAYDKGFDDARQMTRKTFEIELEKREHWIKNIDKLLINLRAKFVNELKKLDQNLVPLAIMVAEHILQREVTAHSDIVIEQAKKAIQAIHNDMVFKIHLHPYTLEILKNVKSSLVADNSKLENTLIVSNDEVDPGSCIIETSSGIIDASFKAQLEKIKKSLLKIPPDESNYFFDESNDENLKPDDESDVEENEDFSDIPD